MSLLLLQQSPGVCLQRMGLASVSFELQPTTSVLHSPGFLALIFFYLCTRVTDGEAGFLHANCARMLKHTFDKGELSSTSNCTDENCMQFEHISYGLGTAFQTLVYAQHSNRRYNNKTICSKEVALPLHAPKQTVYAKACISVCLTVSTMNEANN